MQRHYRCGHRDFAGRGIIPRDIAKQAPKSDIAGLVEIAVDEGLRDNQRLVSAQLELILLLEHAVGRLFGVADAEYRAAGLQQQDQ